MRVICSTINGKDIEVEVTGGKSFDTVESSYDLNEMFTLCCDDGEVFQVPDWLVDVTILSLPRAAAS